MIGNVYGHKDYANQKVSTSLPNEKRNAVDQEHDKNSNSTKRHANIAGTEGKVFENNTEEEITPWKRLCKRSMKIAKALNSFAIQISKMLVSSLENVGRYVGNATDNNEWQVNFENYSKIITKEVGNVKKEMEKHQ